MRHRRRRTGRLQSSHGRPIHVLERRQVAPVLVHPGDVPEPEGAVDITAMAGAGLDPELFRGQRQIDAHRLPVAHECADVFRRHGVEERMKTDECRHEVRFAKCLGRSGECGPEKGRVVCPDADRAWVAVRGRSIEAAALDAADHKWQQHGPPGSTDEDGARFAAVLRGAQGDVCRQVVEVMRCRAEDGLPFRRVDAE